MKVTNWLVCQEKLDSKAIVWELLLWSMPKLTYGLLCLMKSLYIYISYSSDGFCGTAKKDSYLDFIFWALYNANYNYNWEGFLLKQAILLIKQNKFWKNRDKLVQHKQTSMYVLYMHMRVHVNMHVCTCTQTHTDTNLYYLMATLDEEFRELKPTQLEETQTAKYYIKRIREWNISLERLNQDRKKVKQWTNTI